MVDVAKGREGRNDFVLVLDLPAALGIDRGVAMALCDRRLGLSADALLRVTVAGSAREAGVLDVLPTGATEDDWYVDHRRADGSLAEASSDGVRLFAHYLWVAGLERRRRFAVMTFGTVWMVDVHDVDGTFADVSVHGERPLAGDPAPVTFAGGTRRGIRRAIGDSLVVVADSSLSESDLDAVSALDIDGTEPLAGTSCLVVADPDRDTMHVRRFRNRAVTQYVGACASTAAAVGALLVAGHSTGTMTVLAPDEEVVVTLSDNAITTRGSSTLVAQGRVTDHWLRSSMTSSAFAGTQAIT